VDSAADVTNGEVLRSGGRAMADELNRLGFLSGQPAGKFDIVVLFRQDGDGRWQAEGHRRMKRPPVDEWVTI